MMATVTNLSLPAQATAQTLPAGLPCKLCPCVQQEQDQPRCGVADGGVPVTARRGENHPLPPAAAVPV